MADSPVSLPAAGVTSNDASVSQERRRRWIEFALVLGVAFSSVIFASTFRFLKGAPVDFTNFNARIAVGMIHQILGICVLRYVLLRRGLDFRALGLTWSLPEAGIGVSLAFAALVAIGITVLFMSRVHFLLYGSKIAWPHMSDYFPALTPFFFVYAVINCFFEELLARAFVMTELRQLTGSVFFAGFCSVLLQFSYHTYYGLAGAAAVCSIFAVFAVYYAKTGQALPIIVGHTLYDLIVLFARLHHHS